MGFFRRERVEGKSPEQLRLMRAAGLVVGRTLAMLEESTELVTTAGFEFVRPAKEDVDRRPTFQPNSLL